MLKKMPMLACLCYTETYDRGPGNASGCTRLCDYTPRRRPQELYTDTHSLLLSHSYGTHTHTHTYDFN